MNEIGKRIRQVRESRGISQSEMAFKIGLTQSNYGRLEKNDARLKVNHIIIIAKALDVSINNLITGAETTGIKYLGEIVHEGKRIILSQCLE